MENTVDDLILQKDTSSYSSFFNTQASLLDNDSKNDTVVNENITVENVNKSTGDEQCKTEARSNDINVDIGAENINGTNNYSDDNVQISAEKYPSNKNQPETHDKSDEHCDTKLSPIGRNLENGFGEKTKFQSHIEDENKEHGYNRETHGYNEEESMDNSEKDDILREDSQSNMGDTQQGDVAEADHVEQGRDKVQSQKESMRVSDKLSRLNNTSQNFPSIEELSRLNSTSFNIPSTEVLNTYESSSTKEANTHTNILRTGKVLEMYDQQKDEMAELEQVETKRNSLNNNKSCKEKILTDEENLRRRTDKFKAIEQEDERSNEINEPSKMEIRETSALDSAKTQSNSDKNKEDERQDTPNRYIISEVNGFKTTEGKSDTDRNFENDSKRNVLSVDNKYFTGRLPSLLSRNESIRMANEENGNTNNFEQMAVENLDSSHLYNESDEKNDSGEKRSAKSSLENNKYVYIGKGEIQTMGGKPVTPSRQIQELLEEIKIPPDSNNSMLNKRHKSGSNRTRQLNMTNQHYPDAIMIVQGANDPTKTSLNDINQGTTKMTVEDINKVTSKVLGTNHVEGQYSRFDSMPQIKQIDEYVKQSKTMEHAPQTKTSNYSNETSVYDVIPKDNEVKSIESEKVTNAYDSLSRNEQLPQSPFSKDGRETVITASEIPDEIQRRFKPTSTKNNLHGSQHVNSTSTENDLKAIIASAKVAISTGTETTESCVGFGTTETSGFTLQSDNVSRLKKGTATSRTTSKGMWSTTTQSDNQEALSSLICSNCLQTDNRIHLAGYCTNCQQYLCSTCISVHNTNLDTRKHEIVPSYCKNELAINKYVQATGYCADCSMFLCMKCVIQHCGFRANRHHKIIQSSFVSKSSDRKTEATEFLDKLQDKLEPNTSKKSVDTKKERKKKSKLLADLDKSNPYSSPFKHVPESLYPGPNKKVSQSYTKHPKWAHSSIPNLPYLVQPKPIPDRVIHAAGHHRPLMIYTKPKTGFDAMAAKVKSLRSKYKVKDSSKTARRREQVLFTARPIKSRDGLGLPDIDSVKSYMSGNRSIKSGLVQKTSTGKKEIEFINEHCVSIPFPRGEKRTDILAMAVLMDGRLVVLDKNNNNTKLFNKSFHCIAALQFQNRLMDICASNLCPTDVYAATPKHIYEVSAIKGMDISRKMKIEIKRIEGIVSWKYGVAVISKKTNITWELRLLDYRGNLKSKLEVFNPFTLDIASSSLHHMTSSRGGKFVTISDSKNSCIITIDVTTRVVVHETMLHEGKYPTYLTSDGEGNHNLYVSCDNKVFHISRKGKVVGVLIDKAEENGEIGCIIYNKFNNRMYIKTAKDMISEYQIYF